MFVSIVLLNMRECSNCGYLPQSSFNTRKSGYIPGICRECEKKAARERRRRKYASEAGKTAIKSQNKAWRRKNSKKLAEKFRAKYANNPRLRSSIISRQSKEAKNNVSSDKLSEFLSTYPDLNKYVEEIQHISYLPKTEDPSKIYQRISSTNIRNPLPQNYVGLNYLDNVFPHRFEARTTRCPSLVEAFQDHDLLLKIVEYIINTNRVPSLPLIIRNLKFKIKTPSHFFPSSAAAICNEFARGKDVFDPFVGWGGRLLGAICSDVISYHGTDLQEKTIVSGEKVFEDFRSLSGTRVTLEHSEFSIFMQSTSHKYDLILTSPPFLNTEYYGQKSSESVSDWISMVVVPLVTLSHRILRNDGIVAIHAQDRNKMPVRSSIYSAFMASGFQLRNEFRYGKRKGQVVAIFRISS